MKNLKIFFVLALVSLGLSGCEDDSLKATLKSDVAPNELQTPSSESFVLTLEDKDQIMETFEWSETDYGFKASSTYTLQIDFVDNNFSDPVDVLSTQSLSAEVKVSEFNDILLGMGFVPLDVGEIAIRVVTKLSDNIPVVYSNVKTIEVTAYATSFPSIYGMGDALKGWGPWPGNAVEWQSNEFRKYETVAYFTSGKIFRFFQQLNYDPISYNYEYFTSVDANFELNTPDDSKNFKFIGSTGWYKVKVDLNTKVVTSEAVAEPVLYMMGAALNGWGPWPSAAVKMTYLKPGVFEAQATFTSQEIFRFFGQPDWSPTSYNYEFFTTVDSKFGLNTPDNDKNFKYLGETGSQKITVDLNEKTVTVGEPPVPVLFMTGGALNGWGWAEGQYISLVYKGGNTFEATANFTSGGIFRFFAQTDWGPTSYNYEYFTTVDSEFELNAGDNDKNFKYLGATGSRKVTVNMDTKQVTLD